MINYIELEDAVYIIARLGFHVRDLGLLSSALERPKTTLFGEEAYQTVHSKAAALFESTLRNHALIDGNKRLGWVLCATFLTINGYQHTLNTEQAFDLVLGVATGKIPLAEATKILKENSTLRK